MQHFQFRLRVCFNRLEEIKACDKKLEYRIEQKVKKPSPEHKEFKQPQQQKPRGSDDDDSDMDSEGRRRAALAEFLKNKTLPRSPVSTPRYKKDDDIAKKPKQEKSDDDSDFDDSKESRRRAAELLKNKTLPRSPVSTPRYKKDDDTATKPKQKESDDDSDSDDSKGDHRREALAELMINKTLPRSPVSTPRYKKDDDIATKRKDGDDNQEHIRSTHDQAEEKGQDRTQTSQVAIENRQQLSIVLTSGTRKVYLVKEKRQETLVVGKEIRPQLSIVLSSGNRKVYQAEERKQARPQTSQVASPQRSMVMPSGSGKVYQTEERKKDKPKTSQVAAETRPQRSVAVLSEKVYQAEERIQVRHQTSQVAAETRPQKSMAVPSAKLYQTEERKKDIPQTSQVTSPQSSMVMSSGTVKVCQAEETRKDRPKTSQAAAEITQGSRVVSAATGKVSQAEEKTQDKGKTTEDAVVRGKEKDDELFFIDPETIVQFWDTYMNERPARTVKFHRKLYSLRCYPQLESICEVDDAVEKAEEEEEYEEEDDEEEDDEEEDEEVDEEEVFEEDYLFTTVKARRRSENLNISSNIVTVSEHSNETVDKKGASGSEKVHAHIKTRQQARDSQNVDETANVNTAIVKGTSTPDQGPYRKELTEAKKESPLDRLRQLMARENLPDPTIRTGNRNTLQDSENVVGQFKYVRSSAPVSSTAETRPLSKLNPEEENKGKLKKDLITHLLPKIGFFPGGSPSQSDSQVQKIHSPPATMESSRGRSTFQSESQVQQIHQSSLAMMERTSESETSRHMARMHPGRSTSQTESKVQTIMHKKEHNIWSQVSQVLGSDTLDIFPRSSTSESDKPVQQIHHQPTVMERSRAKSSIQDNSGRGKRDEQIINEKEHHILSQVHQAPGSDSSETFMDIIPETSLRSPLTSHEVPSESSSESLPHDKNVEREYSSQSSADESECIVDQDDDDLESVKPLSAKEKLQKLTENYSTMKNYYHEIDDVMARLKQEIADEEKQSQNPDISDDEHSSGLERSRSQSDQGSHENEGDLFYDSLDEQQDEEDYREEKVYPADMERAKETLNPDEVLKEEPDAEHHQELPFHCFQAEKPASLERQPEGLLTESEVVSSGYNLFKRPRTVMQRPVSSYEERQQEAPHRDQKPLSSTLSLFQGIKEESGRSQQTSHQAKDGEKVDNRSKKPSMSPLHLLLASAAGRGIPLPGPVSGATYNLMSNPYIKVGKNKEERGPSYIPTTSQQTHVSTSLSDRTASYLQPTYPQKSTSETTKSETQPANVKNPYILTIPDPQARPPFQQASSHSTVVQKLLGVFEDPTRQQQDTLRRRTSSETSMSETPLPVEGRSQEVSTIRKQESETSESSPTLQPLKVSDVGQGRGMGIFGGRVREGIGVFEDPPRQQQDTRRRSSETSMSETPLPVEIRTQGASTVERGVQQESERAESSPTLQPLKVSDVGQGRGPPARQEIENVSLETNLPPKPQVSGVQRVVPPVVKSKEKRQPKQPDEYTVTVKNYTKPKRSPIPEYIPGFGMATRPRPKQEKKPTEEKQKQEKKSKDDE